MKATRILLADDHAILRAGLRSLLSEQPDMEVVAEAESGLETLSLAESLQPDAILLDLTMPGLNGLEALPLLRQRAPDSQVLVLTMHDDEGYVREALQAGAAGYILKRAVDSELIDAIRAVVRGEVYIHSTLTRVLLDGILPNHASSAAAADPWESLSEREFSVMRLIALGYTNADIADQLSISVKTVETYRARGMEKLGLNSRAELVRAALKRGLLD